MLNIFLVIQIQKLQAFEDLVDGSKLIHINGFNPQKLTVLIYLVLICIDWATS